MKKVLLILLAVGIGFYSFGQKATKVVNKGKIANAAAMNAAPITGEEMASGPVINSNPTTHNNRIGLELIIGKTKYDCQTNRSMAQRIYMLSNGKIPAVWTFANSGTPWNDRGTGYNLYTGGGVWSPYPVNTTIASMQRLEALKIGWANYIAYNNEGSELVVAHNGTTLMVNMMKRTTLGTGNWSDVTPASIAIEWPRVATSNNGNTIHVIGARTPQTTKNLGIMYAVGYMQSTDGGTTWTTLANLPGEDSTWIKQNAPEMYAIDANGNTVAVVMGGYYNDVYLFKSTNNGNNWSKTLIWDFPGAPFNPDSTVGIPSTDTVPTFDGAFSVVVDNNGKVHFWSGVTMFNIASAGTYYYWPQQCGLIYWRDDMPTITGDLSLCSNFAWPWNYYVERNGNTVWDCIQHTGWINMGFNVGGTSMPGGSIGADGKLYVAFQHMSDADPSTFHIYGTDTVPYRHLFAISSTDNGATWSDAFEITPFDEGRDYVFPSVVKNTTDSLRVLYQEDDLPGTSLNPSTGNPHPSGYECDIVYLAVPIEDLVSTPNKNKEAVKVTLYPNPANEYTNITFTLAKAGNINLSVINIMGQKVASYRIDGVSGKNYKQLNTETLASGIYVVKIEAEGKVYTEKLIVN